MRMKVLISYNFPGETCARVKRKDNGRKALPCVQLPYSVLIPSIQGPSGIMKLKRSNNISITKRNKDVALYSIMTAIK